MSKYKNIRTNGYASKREAARALELHLLEKIGEISELKQQVRFELIPKQDGERSVSYVCDFQYLKNGELVTEDVKGRRTDVFNLKRKLMLWIHKIKILET